MTDQESMAADMIDIIFQNGGYELLSFAIASQVDVEKLKEAMNNVEIVKG